jgi:hypothetical protein
VERVRNAVFLAYIPISDYYQYRPRYVSPMGGPSNSSYVLDPLTTLLSNRETRTVLALERARSMMSGGEYLEERSRSVDGGYFPHWIPIKDLKVPLGWKLSAASVARMQDLIAPKDACLDVERSEYESAKAKKSREQSEVSGPLEPFKSDNACKLRMIARLFSVSTERRFELDRH